MDIADCVICKQAIQVARNAMVVIHCSSSIRISADRNGKQAIQVARNAMVVIHCSSSIRISADRNGKGPALLALRGVDSQNSRTKCIRCLTHGLSQMTHDAFRTAEGHVGLEQHCHRSNILESIRHACLKFVKKILKAKSQLRKAMWYREFVSHI